MKTRITFLAILTLFFASTFTSIGQVQETTQEQEEYAKNKLAVAEAQNSKSQAAEMKVIAATPEERVKKHTLELQQLLNLNEEQTLRIHDVLLAVENEMINIRAVSDENERSISMTNLENARNDKLKEFLTDEQYKMYQNYLGEQQ